MSIPVVENPAFPAVRRRYSASNHAPKFARLFVRSQLGTWRLRHMADAVETVTSELVTNAVRHGGGPAVDVRLEKTPTSVVVAVSDANPASPELGNCDPLAENGRGLLIVRALSARTGCTANDSGGKTVWSEVMR